MTKNIEKIFLGVLWLMTIALATTFWMSTRYGFNIFSSAHWTYLSTLQANRAQIKPDFYISLLVALVISIIGLYLMIHPHLRKIKIFGVFGKKSAQQAQTTTTTQQTSKPKLFGLCRPRSPISGSIKRIPKAPVATADSTLTPTPIQLKTPSATNTQNAEISKLFEDAGYEIIPTKKLENLDSPVLAFSYDRNLIVAIANASPNDVMKAIGTLMTFCEDSLGENFEELMLRGYIVAPTDNENPNTELIKTFETMDSLKEFLANNKNVKPDDFDQGLHDAFSLFLKTMISYIGKL